MARVPYAPENTVVPTGPTPSYLNQYAPPAFFGGYLAEGEKQLATGLGQVGTQVAQAASTIQDVHNTAAVDQAYNATQEQFTNLLHGDPNNPNDTGFYGNRGAAALDAYKGLQQQMEQTRQTTLNSLGNDRQRLLYDVATRRLSSYLIERAGNYASQQHDTWAISTQIQGQVSKINAIGASDPTDEDGFQHNLQDGLRNSEQKVLWANGVTKEQAANNPDIQQQIKNEQFKFTENAYTTRAERMAQVNPAAAVQFIDQNAAKMQPNTVIQLRQRYQSLDNGITGAAVGRAAYDGSLGQAPTSATGLKAAIRGQEGTPEGVTSVAGAKGVMQVTPGFFLEHSHPGEDFNNADDRTRVADRGIDTLNAKYNGDASRVAVAYFSGENNVAPEGSATPWKENRSDPNGTTVAQYVNGVVGRLGGQPVTQAAATDVSQSPDRQQRLNALLDRLPTMSPQAGQVALRTFETLSAAEDKARRDTEEQASSKLTAQIIEDPTKVSYHDISTAPVSSTRMEALSNFYDARIKEMAGGDKDVKTYGPGFWEVYKAIHAPEGDPTRLTDPTAIYNRTGPNGELTVAGTDKLLKELQGRQTPEGVAESEMKKQFLVAARGQITGANELMHLRDPKGEELYLKFMASVLPQYDQQRAAGKSAAQLLDPSSPDYLGKSISQFRRPMKDWLNDMKEANDPAAAATRETTQPQAPAAASPYTREQLETEMRRRGLLQAAPAAVTPAAPLVPTR